MKISQLASKGACEWQVVTQFGGFLHGSCLRRIRLGFVPDAGKGGLDLLLKPVD